MIAHGIFDAATYGQGRLRLAAGGRYRVVDEFGRSRVGYRGARVVEGDTDLAIEQDARIESPTDTAGDQTVAVAHLGRADDALGAGDIHGVRLHRGSAEVEIAPFSLDTENESGPGPGLIVAADRS